MPLIVPVLVISGRMSLADAVLAATAVLLGQLSAALVLPALDVRTIGRTQAAAMMIVLLAGLFVTGMDGAATLLLGWFVVGICCGGFQYLGTITAALHSRPAFAFPDPPRRRPLPGGRDGRRTAVDGRVAYLWGDDCRSPVAFGLNLAIGIFLHRPLTSSSRTAERRSSGGVVTFVALAIVFLLFVGQSGLLAYAIQPATDRGIVLRERLMGFGRHEGCRRSCPAVARHEGPAEQAASALCRAWRCRLPSATS